VVWNGFPFRICSLDFSWSVNFDLISLQIRCFTFPSLSQTPRAVCLSLSPRATCVLPPRPSFGRQITFSFDFRDLPRSVRPFGAGGGVRFLSPLLQLLETSPSGQTLPTGWVRSPNLLRDYKMPCHPLLFCAPIRLSPCPPLSFRLRPDRNRFVSLAGYDLSQR